MLRKALLSLVSHRTAALLRWDLHFLAIRSGSRLRGVRARIARQISSSPRPLYLNLGSGPRGVASPRWLNIDGFTDANVHHLVDLSRPLPIPDATINGIFCEHVQEHFTLEDGIGLLKECHRVLIPGGWLRLIMPDAELVIRTYLDEPQELLAHRPVPSFQPMEAVNSYFRQRYEHQCLYDFGLATYALEAAGFTEVTRTSFRIGKCPDELILDDPKYAWESLYVTAVKPA
jgi:predicted SAM-dependent methyltransferase